MDPLNDALPRTWRGLRKAEFVGNRGGDGTYAETGDRIKKQLCKLACTYVHMAMFVMGNYGGGGAYEETAPNQETRIQVV
jgi:hypothetical protein